VSERGFRSKVDDVLGEGAAPSGALLQWLSPTTESQMETIAVAAIREPRWRPADDPADPAYRGLKASVRASGIIQPLVLRLVEGGYEVVSGARRLRAARQTGQESVPALVRDLNDLEALLGGFDAVTRSGLTVSEREEFAGLCVQAGMPAADVEAMLAAVPARAVEAAPPAVAAPVAEPVFKATPPPVVEPIVEAMAVPVVDPAADAVAEPVVEPVVEPVAETAVAEPVAEPVAEAPEGWPAAAAEPVLGAVEPGPRLPVDPVPFPVAPAPPVEPPAASAPEAPAKVEAPPAVTGTVIPIKVREPRTEEAPAEPAALPDADTERTGAPPAPDHPIPAVPAGHVDGARAVLSQLIVDGRTMATAGVAIGVGAAVFLIVAVLLGAEAGKPLLVAAIVAMSGFLLAILSLALPRREL
jgi:hypothetical protein